MNKVLRALSANSRMEASSSIAASLQNVPAYRNAKSVAVFLSMKTEVDTTPIMKYCSSQSKTLLVPKIISDCEFELVTLDRTNRLIYCPRTSGESPFPCMTTRTAWLSTPNALPT